MVILQLLIKVKLLVDIYPGYLFQIIRLNRTFLILSFYLKAQDKKPDSKNATSTLIIENAPWIVFYFAINFNPLFVLSLVI